MAAAHDPLRNPFYLLEVATDASAQEVERAATALIRRLDQREPGADFYGTPLGSAPRDRDDVREAAQALRDPQRRIVYEMWAQVPARHDSSAPPSSVDTSLRHGDSDGFDALAALGWGFVEDEA